MEETTLKIAAKKFLQKGIKPDIEENDLALACNQMINEASARSIKSGLNLARKLSKRSEGRGGILELAAAKTLARLTHMNGAHSKALPVYLKAYKLAGANPLDRARINRALIDVYMYLGDFAKAQNAARKAIAAFKRLEAESDVIKAEINYANLLHRQDQHNKAGILYKKGADYFEKEGNDLAAARCKYNLANTQVQLFNLENAKTLYKQAEKIYSDAGFTLDANDARYGLAWLDILTGKLHNAIKSLLTCKKIYHDGGDPRGEGLCILDLAEVYLGLGLYTDALSEARASRKIFTRLKLRYETAKSSLFMAQAAHVIGHKKIARQAGAEAKKGFLEENNVGFTGVTYLLEAELAERDNKLKREKLKLARSCFKRSQLPLWEAVSDLKQAVYPRLAHSALQRVSKNRAAHNVPHLYAMWQIAVGDKNAKKGNLKAARLNWKKAADRLDLVRAQLPPVELRSSYGHNQSSPHLRLISSELQNDQKKSSAWLERYKTAGIWSSLPIANGFQEKRNAAEESLRLLASQVAALAGQVYDRSAQRSLTMKKTQTNISKLQKQIREHIVNIEDSARPAIGSIRKIIDDIKMISFQMPIVQFHQQQDDIIIFVHNNGETSNICLTGGVSRLKKTLSRWRFLLEGELLSEQIGGTWEYGPEQDLWTDLGNWLWSPLEIKQKNQRILIIPEGDLANLPWEALCVNNEPLSNHHQFIISPSIRHFMAAQNRKINSSVIEVFKGKADNLSGIDKELEIFKAGNKKQINLFDPCYREMWPSSGDALIWHFAGHSIMRIENPFYSHLLLEDGPLFAIDFRLKHCQVGMVTLAACRSGEQVALPGEETTGLIRSLLEMGARNVIASRWPVSDESTSIWMRKFYYSFFENYDILESAHIAAESVRKKFPSAYYWAGFAVFGAGNMGGGHEN